MIDLDHFKAINDRYGHPAGDACLRATADLIKAIGREHECHAARYGGEEFVVVFPLCDQATAFSHAEKIRSAIEASAIAISADKALHITASIGVATRLGALAANPDTLVASADSALYRAKRSGRNVVRTADDGMIAPHKASA